MRPIALVTVSGLTLAALGCTHHTVEVKPIYMTVDVNIKVDQQLDRFFDFEDEMAAAQAEPPSAPASTQGVAQ